MNIRASDLWRWEGSIDRGPFAVIGLTLALLKYGLDYLLVSTLCGRTWTPLNYWIAGDTFGTLLTDPSLAAARWALLATSLPFMWTGVVLILRRLRSTALPAGLVGVFFIPGMNFLFFILLMLLPPREVPAAGERREGSGLGRLIPRSRVGAALMAMILSALPVGVLILTGTQVLRNYGFGLFVGMPFLIGFFSTVLYEYHQPRTVKDSFGVTLASLGFLGLGLLFIAAEGIICLFMAAPIAIAIALLGSIVAHAIRPSSSRGAARTMLGLLMAVTLLMGMEYEIDPAPPLQAVRTVIDIDAPPAAVWARVVSFSEIPAPTELMFKTGIAYPLRADIQGTGVGAVRHCVFTTGAFVEPITTWDEPRLLGFGVQSQPAPMEEWTPYKGIHPPHLDGYFVSQRGQFLLTPLPGNRTRLEGTTWYTHKLWPTAYWGLWSDLVIHRIHERVLRHVKNLAEEKGAGR